jgi:colicin import membrane protein
MDSDGVTALFAKHTTFGYLEPGVTKVAKGLAAALAAGGSRVGVSKPDEAASEAVHFAAAPASAAFGEGFTVRQFGGGGALGGARKPALGGDDDAEADAADAADARRAAAKEAKEATARASLFARPGKGGAAAAAAAPAEEDEGPVAVARPAKGAAAAAGGDDGFGDGADDIDAAFAAMSAGGGGDAPEQVAVDEDGLM